MMILEPKKIKSVTEGEICHWAEWKAGLKLSIQKTKIMASGPITSWQIDGGKWQWQTLFSLLKSYVHSEVGIENDH